MNCRLGFLTLPAPAVFGWFADFAFFEVSESEVHSENYGALLGGPYRKEYSTSGSISGGPPSRRLTFLGWAPCSNANKLHSAKACEPTGVKIA